MGEETAATDGIVWVHSEEKAIIYYKEPHSTSKEQLDSNFSKIRELGEQFGKYNLLIDLTQASRPKAEIRYHILEKFAELGDKVNHIGIFTEKNSLLNMAATFVMRKTGLKSFTINKTMKEAEKAIEKSGK